MEKTRCGKDANEYSRCQNKYNWCEKRKECEIIWEEYLFLNLTDDKPRDPTDKEQGGDSTSQEVQPTSI